MATPTNTSLIHQLTAALGPELERLVDARVKARVAELAPKEEAEPKRKRGRPKKIRVKSPKDGKFYTLSSDPDVAYYEKRLLGIK